MKVSKGYGGWWPGPEEWLADNEALIKLHITGAIGAQFHSSNRTVLVLRLLFQRSLDYLNFHLLQIFFNNVKWLAMYCSSCGSQLVTFSCRLTGDRCCKYCMLILEALDIISKHVSKCQSFWLGSTVMLACLLAWNYSILELCAVALLI